MRVLPGCDPDQHTHGSASTFEEARAAFEKSWQKLAATRTEIHFEIWRRHRDFSAWKSRMTEERLLMRTHNQRNRPLLLRGGDH